MIIRKKHPSKDITQAIKYAESMGWRYKKAGGSAHIWGMLLCLCETREGCVMPIWSTPKDTFKHAEKIKQSVKRCPHKLRDE